MTIESHTRFPPHGGLGLSVPLLALSDNLHSRCAAISDDLWCLIPLVCYIGFLNGDLLSIAASLAGSPPAGGRSPVRNLVDPYIFCSHLSGLNFALGASYEFEPTFFGQAAGALVVLVMGGPRKRKEKKQMGHPRSQHFVLASRDIESVTRREGRWGFSKVYPWNGRIQP